jgi:hypothetical protein
VVKKCAVAADVIGLKNRYTANTAMVIESDKDMSYSLSSSFYNLLCQNGFDSHKVIKTAFNRAYSLPKKKGICQEKKVFISAV